MREMHDGHTEVSLGLVDTFTQWMTDPNRTEAEVNNRQVQYAYTVYSHVHGAHGNAVYARSKLFDDFL